MKSTFRLAAACSAFVIAFSQFLASPSPAAAQEPGCRPVSEALAAGEITLLLEVNEDMFYNEPLNYNAENIIGDRVEFCFPAGMIMVSGNGGYQNLVLTRTVDVILGAGERRQGRLAAACVNLDKDAPATGMSFEPGPMAGGDVLGVALAIERNGAQGSLGAQLALWAVTDGLTLGGSGGSASESSDMFRLIAPLLCLAKDELELGQRLLEEADAEVRLYAGDSQSGLQFCQELGLPTDMNQIMLLIGRYSLLTLCCCGGGCGLMLIVLIVGGVLIVRSRKR
jgi:hypothetical protein